MIFQNVISAGRIIFAILSLSIVFSPLAWAQGPSPETVAPLFPGDALISYNFIFTTRDFVSELPGGIPVTARPTSRTRGISTSRGVFIGISIERFWCR